MSNIEVEQKSYEMPPREGISIAHFLTVADVERSARYYEKVFGARILTMGDGNAPPYLQLANIWMILNVGGGPTPDKPTVNVPSIGLIVAGDVVYNQCRMYVGDSTPETRKNWIAALDRLAALNPAIVVAGHKKPGVPDAPSAIQDTKRYLQDFDRVQKTATSDQELFDQMTELYPHWVANQSWLMFGFPGA
jgi:hypothetical protein